MVDPRNPDYSNTPVSPKRPQFNYQPIHPQAEPVVSIVTPFYNTGPIFRENAQSVLQQSLQQFEWIIVNDGSTETESLQILDQYRQCDPRVRVIDHPANRGLPAARNTGFHEARCPYILYLDSDDLLEPTAAEKWLWFLENHPEYAFAGGYSVGFGAQEYLWQSGFQDMEANLEQNRINHVVMIRKEVLQAVGGYDESMRSGLEDWEFWIRCASRGFWGNSIPEYLHWYRTRPIHADRWEGLNEDHIQALSGELIQRYPALRDGGFPHPRPHIDLQLLQLKKEPLYENKLVKSKPRLLLIAPWMVMGGAEKFNLDLIRQLTSRGWEITLVTTARSNNPWQFEFEQFTPDVFPLPGFIEWGDYPRFLKTIIQSRQVDMIMVASSHEAYRLLPLLRILFPRIPILDYLHMVTPEWMDGGFPRLSVMFQDCLDLHISSSQHVKDWLVQNGIQEDKARVCTTNTDADYWKPDHRKRAELRRQSGIPDEQTLIFYIGRIEQQKQPRVFARTMQNLALNNLSFTCLVIGDGTLKDWLEEYVLKENLREHIRFLGEIPSDQVHDWMRAGDIVFLPSENEGISLTFYEGMATGLVPVGADVGGQRELITPDCGILCQRGSEEDETRQYTHALTELIYNPEKRQQMGITSRERILAHFRLEQMGTRIEELINEATQKRNTAQKEPASQDTAWMLARQAVEYMRALNAYQDEKGEEARLEKIISEYKQENARLIEHPPMPPAPARTYFYFTIRQILYPVFGKGTAGKSWMSRVYQWIKRRLV